MALPPPDQPAAGSGNVFVSYSRRDLDWVRQLVTDLDRAGLPVWLDVHQLKPGVVWDSEIERALHTTDILLVILSENSAASRNVLDEINFALSKDRLVVPVLYRPCDVPYRLARLQHVDFTANYDLALRDLIERLKAARGAAPQAPATSDKTFHRTVRTEVPPWLLASPAAPNAERRRGTKPVMLAGGLAAGLAIGAGAWYVVGRDGPSATPAPPTSASAPAREAGAPAEAGPPAAPVAAPSAAVSEGPRASASLPAAEPRTPPAGEAATRTPPVSVPPAPAATSPEPVVMTARPASAPPSTRPDPVGTPAPVLSEDAHRSAVATIAAAPPAPPVLTAPPVASAAPHDADPAPSPSRPAPAVEDDAVIRRVIATYARAINEKSASLLSQVRPTLSRTEAETLLKSTPANHSVAFADVAIRVDGTTASVRLTRQDVVRDAAPLRTALTLTLAKQGENWVIERIQRAQ
jgi:hypothetical protein